MKLFKKKNKDVVSQSNLLELNELLKKYELEGAINKEKIDLMVRIKQINTLLNKLNMSKIKKQFFWEQELIFIKFLVFVIGCVFGYFLPLIMKFLFRFYLKLKFKEKKYMDLMDNMDSIDNDFWGL